MSTIWLPYFTTNDSTYIKPVGAANFPPINATKFTTIIGPHESTKFTTNIWSHKSTKFTTLNESIIAAYYAANREAIIATLRTA